MNNTNDQGTQTKKQQDASGSDLKRIKVSIDALTDQIKAQRREQTEREKQNKWPKRTAIAAIVYTVVTFLIMLIYGWQNYLIRSNNVVSQRAFISFGFRPGASVDAATPKTFTLNDIQDALTHGAPPSALSFVVDITNGGNTGTKNLTFLLKCVPSSQDMNDPWPLLYEGKNNPIKVPQFIGPHTTLQSGCAFPMQQVSAMQAGILFGYVMIDATYQDRLTDDWHRTEATGRVQQITMIPGVGSGGSMGVNVTAILVTYGNHNCADEECPAN
jgi:hypothetical protein